MATQQVSFYETDTHVYYGVECGRVTTKSNTVALVTPRYVRISVAGSLVIDIDLPHDVCCCGNEASLLLEPGALRLRLRLAKAEKGAQWGTSHWNPPFAAGGADARSARRERRARSEAEMHELVKALEEKLAGERWEMSRAHVRAQMDVENHARAELEGKRRAIAQECANDLRDWENNNVEKSAEAHAAAESSDEEDEELVRLRAQMAKIRLRAQKRGCGKEEEEEGNDGMLARLRYCDAPPARAQRTLVVEFSARAARTAARETEDARIAARLAEARASGHAQHADEIAAMERKADALAAQKQWEAAAAAYGECLSIGASASGARHRWYAARSECLEQQGRYLDSARDARDALTALVVAEERLRQFTSSSGAPCDVYDGLKAQLRVRAARLDAS